MIEGKMQIAGIEKTGYENINVTSIKMDFIRLNPQQPKRQYVKTTLDQLSETIKVYGVKKPVYIKRMSSSYYELVTGEKVFRAAAMAGLKEIPSIVVTDDEEAALLTLTEVLNDEELNYIEEAEYYQELLTKYNSTQEELARKIGKSQSTIANKIRLLKLPPLVKKILIDNNLTERHARALLKLSDEQLQLKVLKFVCDKNLNVKKTEELIKRAIQKFVNQNDAKVRDKSYGAVKNMKTFVSTVKNAIDLMKRSGVDVKAAKIDRGKYVEFIIRVPKDSEQ
jgi:ParB family chromosome partitioning protein